MEYLSTGFLCGAGFLITLFSCAALLLTKKFHGDFTNDDVVGVQKFHHGATPRVGGIALALGFLVVLLLTKAETFTLLLIIGLAGLPALIFGLAEDILKTISVRTRLLATIASGLIFVLLSGYSLSNIGIPAFSPLLAVPVISIVFTAFAIGGIANAINLIDGFHGLAIGTLIFISLSFALVGWRVGDDFIFSFALILASIFAGLFVINFPTGKLFLGDGGAYFAGFLVGVLAVMLPSRNSDVSPWISLLILGYPVMETVFSIGRRFLQGDAGLGQPDSAHLHHRVYKSWSRNMTIFGVEFSQNAVTSVMLWLIPASSLGLVYSAEPSTKNAAVLVALCGAVYMAMFAAVIRSSQKMPDKIFHLGQAQVKK